MPRNASLDGQGFRFYGWTCAEGPGCTCGARPGEEVRVLSVTSIRRLNGMNHMLVEWSLGNVVKLAMGIRKVTRVGPRGGVKEVYVADGPFPGEFVRRMTETEGDEAKLDAVRKWLRNTADEPRDVAAVRGSVVHKLIELNVKLDRLDDDVIRAKFEDEWRGEKRKVKPDITADDLNFVYGGMRQYWDMRAKRPFVILAQEPQVWNLTAGYAGSADVLMWFLPDGQDVRERQQQANRGLVTIETIAEVGGRIALGDWKTSKGVYTDHVIQMMAYLAAEFVGSDGQRNERLTGLLEGMLEAALVHIRPDGWNVDFVDFKPEVLRAFLGSVAFARFNALYPNPQPLFTESWSGSADPTHEEDAA
ncbi:MAG TPA: hypothetical protein VFI40_04850 [Nocardioides sp.]|nr:hypothetical protein [Nocardioides sp.]